MVENIHNVFHLSHDNSFLKIIVNKVVTFVLLDFNFNFKMLV